MNGELGSNPRHSVKCVSHVALVDTVVHGVVYWGWRGPPSATTQLKGDCKMRATVVKRGRGKFRVIQLVMQCLTCGKEMIFLDHFADRYKYQAPIHRDCYVDGFGFGEGLQAMLGGRSVYNG